MINISTGLYIDPREIMLETVLKLVSKKYPTPYKRQEGGRTIVILKSETQAVMGAFGWLMGRPLDGQEDKDLIIKIIKEAII